MQPATTWPPSKHTCHLLERVACLARGCGWWTLMRAFFPSQLWPVLQPTTSGKKDLLASISGSCHPVHPYMQFKVYRKSQSLSLVESRGWLCWSYFCFCIRYTITFCILEQKQQRPTAQRPPSVMTNVLSFILLIFRGYIVNVLVTRVKIEYIIHSSHICTSHPTFILSVSHTHTHILQFKQVHTSSSSSSSCSPQQHSSSPLCNTLNSH